LDYSKEYLSGGKVLEGRYTGMVCYFNIMPSPIIPTTVVVLLISIAMHKLLIEPLFLSPLSRIPGPKLYAITKWRLALDEWLGNRSLKISNLHKQYGPVVRISPSEVSFNSLSSMKTIYGAGSYFERTSFYDMFDVYGIKNLFTFHDSKSHSDRKRLLAHAYSKSSILKPRNTELVRKKISQYLQYLDAECEPDGRNEIFHSLHYFAIDAITEFLYGPMGATNCLVNSGQGLRDRKLLNDIVSVQRRRLSWFAVHFSKFTKWLYSRTGMSATFVKWLYPMTPPTTYTGIRQHALSAWNSFLEYAQEKEAEGKTINGPAEGTIVRLLYNHHESVRDTGKGGLKDLDIASECADHLLAGIDTTSDSLMFFIWAISRPENAHVQARLIAEIDTLTAEEIDSTDGIPKPEVVMDVNRMPYLDMVIKETLRLYAPLPASEPRSFPADIEIDGFDVPAGTVVGLSPYALHRNESVFKDSLKFDPERWDTADDDSLAEMKRWWWAFSSGPRMCIGIQ
jgi:Cytochrome P450